MEKEKYNKNYEEIVCKNCKIKFNSPTWRKSKYCSHKCAAQSPNKGRYKKGHTESIEIKSKRIKNIKKNTPKGKLHYNYLDGRSKLVSPRRYGDDWENIRFLVYERDNYTCQDCGITTEKNKRALDVHHKIPFLESFDNSIGNLITLCASCHKKIESQLIKQNREDKKMKIKND